VVANVPPRLRIENLSLRLLERHQAEPSDPLVLGACPRRLRFRCPVSTVLRSPVRLREAEKCPRTYRPEQSDKMSLIAG
jgi:hypothetical protein